MLIVDGRQNRFCDRVNRRTFLHVGGLALGGACLPQLLQAEQSAGVRGGHKGIIMIYMPGGPPHQDLYDLKPDAPPEIRGEFDPIDTNVPGIQICELLPRLAARMDRLAIIRSLVGSDGAHASSLCSTGYPFGRSPPGGAPNYGSVVSVLKGPTSPAIPACADLSERMQHSQAQRKAQHTRVVLVRDRATWCDERPAAQQTTKTPQTPTGGVVVRDLPRFCGQFENGAAGTRTHGRILPNGSCRFYFRHLR
jgi:hypothetical protein